MSELFLVQALVELLGLLIKGGHYGAKKMQSDQQKLSVLEASKIQK